LKLIDAIRTLCEKAGLTQAELARKMGVSTARIARLEDPDYDGQTVRDLHAVGSALGMELELRFVKKPAKKRRAKTAGAA
jgi:transcriptional regulator with XRE-family HTH domain